MPYYPDREPESSGEEHKQPRITEKLKKFLRMSFAVVSGIAENLKKLLLPLFAAAVSRLAEMLKKLLPLIAAAVSWIVEKLKKLLHISAAAISRLSEKQKKLLRLSVAVISCLLIVYGTVRLIGYGKELNASRETSRELQQINEREKQEMQETQETKIPLSSPESIASASPLPAAFLTSPLPAAAPATPLPAETPQAGTADTRLKHVLYPDNPYAMISDRFAQLRKKGKYIVGWISFDLVDEAVVQKDNTYFLTHDATGNDNNNGAIFLDADISLLTRPYTIILYGHNMKSGNMFGRLKKYKESSFFRKHQIITFDTMYENGQYAVFAVMEMSTTPGVAMWYNLWSLATDIRADREDAIREIEKRSAVSSVLDVQADDQILLLVTCLDGDTERLVVAARRLRENESPENLVIRQGR